METESMIDGSTKGDLMMRFAGLALLAPLLAFAAGRPIPQLEKKDGRTRLIVDGAPYLILGAQVHNSTNSNAEDLAKAFDVVAGLHANVAEAPVYWESIEPREGQFDFRTIDQALEAARKRDLRLVLLWFGSWKNGESHYVPEWVKRDKKRFTRVTGPRGEETEILSPLCEEAREADARAFGAFMRRLAEVDQEARTVLMVQVENEPGLVGADRDYSSAATRAFESAAPPELLDFLSKRRGSLSASLKMAWAGSNYRTSGSWKEVFGELAPEAFSAWCVSRYIEAVAAAGKREYPLPLYVNVWLIEGVERAGAWPSGGATEHVIDIWKAAAPSIDILAPDIYYPKFYDVCSQYQRPDNVLWVPETNFNPYFAGFIYQVFGYFNGLGFSPFGIDDAQKGGAAAAIAAQFEDAYGVLRPLLPLIARYQYTGRIHPVLQGVAQGEDWKHSIRVGSRLAANVEFTVPYNPEQSRGRGMIIELAPDDFLVVGAGFKVTFRELDGPPRDAQLLSIEEGTFEGERWMSSRRWNGDERHVALPEKSTALRVRVLRP
jgi:hypothetical protein